MIRSRARSDTPARRARSRRVLVAALLLTSTAAAMATANAADDAAAPGTPSSSSATIAVSGDGEVRIQPDRAIVSIAIESDAASSAAAGAQNARLTQAVVKALRAAGATSAQIVTQAYSVQPQWQYSPNAPPRRTGYEASMQLALTVPDLQRLGPAIDAALSAGATRIGNVEFESSQLQSARQQALAMAVEHAHADAETLARAAGGRLGALLDLSTSGAVMPPGPRPLMLAAGRAEVSTPGTGFEATELQISASVQARWRFEPPR